MYKLLLALFVAIASVVIGGSGVFANYIPTKGDEVVVNTLVLRFNQNIKTNGEQMRSIITDRLKNAASKQSGRVQYILMAVQEKLGGLKTVTMLHSGSSYQDRYGNLTGYEDAIVSRKGNVLTYKFPSGITVVYDATQYIAAGVSSNWTSEIPKLYRQGSVISLKSAEQSYDEKYFAIISMTGRMKEVFAGNVPECHITSNKNTVYGSWLTHSLDWEGYINKSGKKDPNRARWQSQAIAYDYCMSSVSTINFGGSITTHLHPQYAGLVLVQTEPGQSYELRSDLKNNAVITLE